MLCWTFFHLKSPVTASSNRVFVAVISNISQLLAWLVCNIGPTWKANACRKRANTPAGGNTQPTFDDLEWFWFRYIMKSNSKAECCSNISCRQQAAFRATLLLRTSTKNVSQNLEKNTRFNQTLLIVQLNLAVTESEFCSPWISRKCQSSGLKIVIQDWWHQRPLKTAKCNSWDTWVYALSAIQITVLSPTHLQSHPWDLCPTWKTRDCWRCWVDCLQTAQG